MSAGDPKIDKLYAAWSRASRAAIAADDAGRSSAKLDAAADRARLRLQAARRGEPTKKSSAQLECETAKSIARAYKQRTGNELEIRKERVGGSVRWFAYYWSPGDAPVLIGPFRTELAACRAMLELAK